jgi:hypothetical protein
METVQTNVHFRSPAFSFYWMAVDAGTFSTLTNVRFACGTAKNLIRFNWRDAERALAEKKHTNKKLEPVYQ